MASASRSTKRLSMPVLHALARLVVDRRTAKIGNRGRDLRLDRTGALVACVERLALAAATVSPSATPSAAPAAMSSAGAPARRFARFAGLSLRFAFRSNLLVLAALMVPRGDRALGGHVGRVSAFAALAAPSAPPPPPAARRSTVAAFARLVARLFRRALGDLLAFGLGLGLGLGLSEFLLGDRRLLFFPRSHRHGPLLCRPPGA